MKVLRMLMIAIGASVVAIGGLAIAGSGSGSSARGDHGSVNSQVSGQQGHGSQGVASDDQAVGSQRGQGQVSGQQAVGQGGRHNGQQVGGQQAGQSGQSSRRGEKRPVNQDDQSQQTQVEVVPQSGQAGQHQGR